LTKTNLKKNHNKNSIAKKRAKHCGLPSSIKKKHFTKPINRGNLDYLGKLANHDNHIKKIKRKKITKPNSQLPSILKDEIDKTKFEKHHNKKKKTNTKHCKLLL